MGRVKGFWQHVENGCIYAIESTPFGEVIGGIGPLNPDDLLELDDYEYGTRINTWLKEALAGQKLRRINPKPLEKLPCE